MRTSSKLVVTLALVSFAFMAVISSSAFADVDLTTEGKVPGKPFDYLQQQIDNIQLTPGPQGPQGEVGPKGDTGAIGPKGNTGDKGNTGATGPQGLQGPQGPQGPAGAPGPQGIQGEQGPSGECVCPITQEQLEEIYDGIEYLESIVSRLARFKDMGDGTIRDNDTGLLWLKNANCFRYMNWSDAMDAARLLDDGQCGLTDGSEAGDWRLPTKKEWEAFYSTVYNAPALVNTVGDAQWSEGDAFTGVQLTDIYGYGGYWSSSEYLMTEAWFIRMRSGSIYHCDKANDHYVWPVHSDND